MPQHTLQLFKILLDKKPLGFSEEAQKKYEQEYERLTGAEVKEIEDVIILYGKESWVFRQAEKEFFSLYGKEKEQELFISLLPPDLQNKWQEFVSEGGSLHDYRHGKFFEDAFTSEENVSIENAVVETEVALRDFLENLSEEKKDEYDALVTKYFEERDQILQKIEELRVLKDQGEKWDDEIDNEVYFFEKGLAELEARPSVAKIQEKIDWYMGQIESGNC